VENFMTGGLLPTTRFGYIGVPHSTTWY